MSSDDKDFDEKDGGSSSKPVIGVSSAGQPVTIETDHDRTDARVIESGAGGSGDAPTRLQRSRPSPLSRPESLRFEQPPRSPRLVPINTPLAVDLEQDTEDNVVSQAQAIINSFMLQEHVLEHCNNVEHIDYDSRHPQIRKELVNRATNVPSPPNPDATPGAYQAAAAATPNSIPELQALAQAAPNTQAIGLQLAMIGDDINRRYAEQFKQMVRMLNISTLNYRDVRSFAYEAFAEIAKSLFSDGRISWGRIVSLLVFGYHLTIDVLKSSTVGDFLNRIISFLIKFITTMQIAQWIARQGGWSAILRFSPESVNIQTFLGICATAAFILACTWYFNR